MDNGQSHHSHQRIIQHIIGKRYVPSRLNHRGRLRIYPMIVLRHINPKWNMNHGEVKLIRIVSRSGRHLFTMIREIHNSISMQVIGGLIHDRFHHIIIKQNWIIIFIIHNLCRFTFFRCINRPMIELSGIAVPITDMAPHQMNDDQLPPVCRIHFF